MIINRQDFFKVQQTIEDIPFNQTEEWLISSYNNYLNQIVFFVNNPNAVQICCWGIVFNRKFIGKHLIIDGESITDDISENAVKDFYQSIVNEGYTIIDISSINYYNVKYEIGIRRVGFLRPLGLSLCPLSLQVDFDKEFNFHRNWKRNVKKSINYKCTYQHISNPTEKDIFSFIELFDKLKKRKKLSFNLSASSLITLVQSKKYELFFVYNKDKSPIAGRIVYINNNKSYDVYAANSEEALNYGATYFLQENILMFLKEKGIAYFDYGRISPGTSKMDSIYVSKNYSGGIPVSYNGQWSYNKNKLLSFMICFRNFFLIKEKIRY